MAAFIDLLAEEGQRDAVELETLMFPEQGGAEWQAKVAEIYSSQRMQDDFREQLTTELAQRDIAGAIGFFESPLGAQAIEVELAARELFLDQTVEDQSRETLAEMRKEGAQRVSLIESYADANGFIDYNVMGALNGNFAFLEVLAGAGFGPFADDPAAILNEIWSQEPEVRQETTEWLMSYFLFAYGPLEDEQVQGLIEFSRSQDSKRLNAALFAAFDDLFIGISRDLAEAAVFFMSSERL